MTRYTCDCCGKDELTENEKRDVCLNCYERLTRIPPRIFDVVRLKMDKEDLKFIDKQKKEKKEIDLSQYQEWKILN
jgi:hypothetical protein